MKRRFVVDEAGERVAVLLDIDKYERMVAREGEPGWPHGHCLGNHVMNAEECGGGEIPVHHLFRVAKSSFVRVQCICQ